MNKIIALDAGHGLHTAGKRCLADIDSQETREWTLNNKIADKLEALLQSYSCDVLRVSDITGEQDISLSQRVRRANQEKASLFLSIHHNAGIHGGSGGGTVVYYYASDPERTAQAQRLYNAIVGQTGLIGNRAQKIQKYGYYVLAHTSMPAFLIENGFMDSTTDTPLILTQQHTNKTAEGILRFLVQELSLTPVDSTQSSTTEASKVPSTEPSAPSSSLPSGDISTHPADNPLAAISYYPACRPEYTTISAALSSIGVNSTYAYRKQIAAANCFKGYTGTAAQNNQMLKLLKTGLLVKI